MQNSMMAARRQPGGEIIDSLAALIAQDHGNAYEEIDPYALEIISKILPSSGIEFLSRMLQHAIVIQNALPQLEELGERVAVINTRTIRLLAKAIQWGYDTTHKYVSVLMSLGFLYRHKYNNGNLLVFPLKTYELPHSLNALDKLITQSRPKVRQFARKVKERLLIYNLIPQVEPETRGISGPSERDTNLQQLLLTSIVGVMKSEGIETSQGTRIAMRLMKEVISKLMSPRQNMLAQLPKGQESYVIGQESTRKGDFAYRSTTSTQERRLTPEKVSHLVEQESTRKGDFAYESTTSTQEKRPAPEKVSHPVEQESTRKGDFAQKSPSLTSKGRLVQEQIAHLVEQKSMQQVGSAQKSSTSIGPGRLQPQQSISAIPIPPAVEEDFSIKSQVCHESEDSNDTQAQNSSQQVTSMIDFLLVPAGHNITDVLNFYYLLLMSEAIDWSDMPLPDTFFQEIYDELNAYYRHTRKNGIILPIHVWTSIEITIIKKAEVRWDLTAENGCIYLFNLSGRVYSKDAQILSDSYASTVREYLPEVETNIATERKAEYQHKVDQSPEVLHDWEDRTSAESTQGTLSRKTHGSEKSSYSISKGDSQIDQSSQQEDPSAYDEDRHETALEAEERRQIDALWALCEPEIKVLRIPTEVDSEDYLEAFSYVLRNRNINILFNNISKNDTLRNNAAQFLTHVFDNDKNNIAVNKHNEKLLNKYEPEVIVNAFIDSIISMHEPGHESLQKPGAFFTSRCKFYQQNKPDFDTDELIRRFSDLSYRAFASEMHTLINSGQKIRNKQYKKRS